MDDRLAIVVYFLIAVAAGFVTASRALSTVALLAIVIVLGVAATLVRRQVLGLGNRSRVTLAWLGTYVLSYLVVAFVLTR
jgi:uncharacterized membrane protein (DUF106 family)